MIRILEGDCRETLRTLEDCSVQCIITSPPYFGLRNYGTEPLVWGGHTEHEHEWRVEQHRGQSGGLSPKQITNPGAWYAPGEHGFCACGAWQGSHGLEPTPELYIQHEVEIFREVRRVLRDDGVLWLNLGDSYANTGNKGQDFSASKVGYGGRGRNVLGGQPVKAIPEGLKPKDLMMMPFRVAMALQADGWWLRSVIPWLKRNSMPESVTDRPATSVEYVFLLSKSPRYYWDADAVRVNASENTHSRGYGDGGPKSREKAATLGMHEGWTASTRTVLSSRNRRNNDWFFESWQGLLLDEQDDPLALVVNPAPFSAWVRTVRRRRVELDAIADGTRRIASPDCQLHEWMDYRNPTQPDDGYVAALVAVLRTADMFDDPVLEQIDERAPTARNRASDSQGDSLGSRLLCGCDAAIPHNSEIRRTDAVLAQHGTAVAEFLSGTPCNGRLHVRPVPSGFGNPDLSEIREGIGRICTCVYYEEYTENTSHFATFPPKLVEPMVKASTRAGDTVLDPFGGAGTTGLVADRLGRNAILCELKPDYASMGTTRIINDAPLFADVVGAEAAD